MFQQAEIGRHPGGAERPEIGGQQFIVGNLVQITATNMGIILPAQHTHDFIACGKVGMPRFDDGPYPGRAHHLADFGRGNIAADIFHPALLGRIETQYLVFNQHMTFGTFRHLGDNLLEIISQQSAASGTSIDQPLPVVGHFLSPLEDLATC